MIDGLNEGTNKCSSCGKLFRARYEKYPENDIRHPIGCPYCDSTVGYASGTDDVTTLKMEMPLKASPPFCPKCGAQMTVRHNKQTGEAFWGCATYPNCNGTRPC